VPRCGSAAAAEPQPAPGAKRPAIAIAHSDADARARESSRPGSRRDGSRSTDLVRLIGREVAEALMLARASSACSTSAGTEMFTITSCGISRPVLVVDALVHQRAHLLGELR
jgi:hypothetical protein